MDNLDHLYKQNYESIQSQLRKLGCPGFIFHDIYHEAYFILFEKEKVTNIKIKNPRTYMTIICRHLWFRERKRQQTHDLFEEILHSHEPQGESRDIRLSLLTKHFKNLSAICREILNLYSLNYTEQKISEMLNLEGPKAVNNHKNYCKAKLKGMIKKDPLYKDING